MKNFKTYLGLAVLIYQAFQLIKSLSNDKERA